MLGKFLEEKLKEKGWSKNYFAQRCGIAVSSVSRIVSGQQTNLTEKMKERIATGLGISLRELENACMSAPLPSMIDEMERISDHLSPVMTARERNQLLSIVNKMRKRLQSNPPEESSEEDQI